MNCFCECEFRQACEGGDKVFVTNKSNVFVANGRTGEILQRIFVENDEEAVGPLAVDGDDLYVVTKTRGMCVYSISGLVIKRRFGDCEAFQKGSGIVVGRDDVYVADGEQNRLLVFKKENGHFDRVLLGAGCPFVCHPTSMALYKNRFLIVAEMGNNRIQVFDITQKNDRLILV
jgi:DNA-binding beta-propeller fold protein YncE